MSRQLASRLDGVSESATLALNAAVQTMKAQGVDVVNLTAGEPDFPVHETAKLAAIDAIKANRSKYTPAAGIPELRAAVAEKTNLQQPSVSKVKPWKPSDVVVTNGGKQALFNAMLALINPGDEVVIPGPYWLSYPEMAKIAGGKPVVVSASFEQGFKITPEQLKRALTARTKMVIFNSPSNPTGGLYSRAEFAALAAVLSAPEHADVWVISDEIYDRIFLGGASDPQFVSFLEAAPGLRDRTITVNGMSKSGAMTGWRIGWSVAPELATQGMGVLQGQSTSGINAPAQWAALAGLKLPESEFASQVASFRARRDLSLEILRKAAKMELYVPQGAFYAFIGIRHYLKPGEDSIAFAERLLRDAKVAVVPGTPFGEPGFVRISFATEEKALREGCERIVKYLS